MALSERDEQMLLELERQFSVEDPELAETMSQPQSAPLRLSPRRVGAGVALVLIGLAALVAGVSVGHELLGVALGLAGFALAVLGVTQALSSDPRGRRAKGQDRTRGEGKPSFMQRQEERWERRQEGRG